MSEKLDDVMESCVDSNRCEDDFEMEVLRREFQANVENLSAVFDMFRLFRDRNISG